MKTEEELKREFARASLKFPNDSFKAALEVFKENTGAALIAAIEWISDSEVIAYKNELISQNEPMDLLPTKVDFCNIVWERMTNEKIFTDDFVKVAKLYADARGWIEKPQSVVNNNLNQVSNKVMIVREKPSDEDWEKGLLDQQDRLTNESKLQ